MSFIYINEQGASVSINGGYFIIKSVDGIEEKVPKETLDSITILGNVNITTPCIRECLIKGISLNYFSSKGLYFGKLSSTKHTKPLRLKSQIYAFDDLEFSLALSKKCIIGKISNQLNLLRRYQRNDIADITTHINKIIISKNKIEQCKSIEQIMGYEGISAREYFSALSELVVDDFKFKGRSKRPSKDAFNAMLNFGYKILMFEVYNEIENRGLSPYIGFLHAIADNHPTLASDMMEEWRAVIVDSVVMSLVQGSEIKINHFYIDTESGGVFLTNEGMKIFINKLEKKFISNANYLCSKEKAVFFRRGIYLQSLAITRAVLNKNIDEYEPVQIR